MSITIADLITPQTSDQIRTTMVGALVSLGIPADQWKKGGSLSTLLTVIATVLAQFSTLISDAAAAGFLETSSGAWLTLVAFYVYGVTRRPATFASGKITLINGGGGIYTGPSYAAGKVTFLNPTTKKTYTNTEDLTLGALGTQTVGLQCTTAGSDGSSAPATITSLVTQLLGVTCSNDLAVVGQDEQPDDDLREQCLNKLGALSVRGPRTAYAYAIDVAVNVVTGAPVNINRYSITRSSHTGQVGIVLASPSGAPDPNDVQGVRNSIETGVVGLSPPFSGARPDCVTVTVSGATPIVYGPTLTVWAVAPAGVAAADVQAEIGANVSAYIEDYPVGGVTTDTGTGLWADGIETACTSKVAKVARVEGAFDLTLAPGQVATDGVTVNVRLVSVT